MSNLKLGHKLGLRALYSKAKYVFFEIESLVRPKGFILEGPILNLLLTLALLMD